MNIIGEISFVRSNRKIPDKVLCCKICFYFGVIFIDPNDMIPSAKSRLIFILKGPQSEKSTLVGCKTKTKVHLFNPDTHEKDTTCKNYWKFVLKCE